MLEHPAVQLWLGPRPGCNSQSVLASCSMLDRLPVQLPSGESSSSCDAQPALPAGRMLSGPPFAGPLPPLGSMSPLGAPIKRARVNLPHTAATLKTKLPPPIISSPRPQPGQQGYTPVAVAAPQPQHFAAYVQPVQYFALKLPVCHALKSLAE